MKWSKIILTHLAIGQPCVLLPSLPVYITFSILIALPVKPDLKKRIAIIVTIAKGYAGYLV